MGKYFGTDGMRGIVGNELTSYHSYIIGRYLGEKSKKGVVIGTDTRISSPMLEYALICGILEGGGNAYTLGVVPTPCVSFALRSEKYDFGVMISASHNPYHDNGIKILNCHGEKLDDNTTSEIEAYIDAPLVAVAKNYGRVEKASGDVSDYEEFLCSTIKTPLSNLRVGIDASNGSAYKIAGDIFLRLGAEVTLIGNEPNGKNINDSCGSTHPDTIRALVTSKRLDVGFAYDGDSDRCIAIDKNGEIIDGDKILYILGCDLKRKGELKKDTIVATVMSNAGLNISLSKKGIKLARTNVGDRFVYEEMKSNGYALGGEQSGHIIVSKYANTGDGILTSLLLAELSVRERKSLGELSMDVEIFPQVNKNVRVKSKEETLNSTALWDKVRLLEKSLDGGRILVRASGTEPLIRILVEGKSHSLCEKITSSLEKTIEAISNA